MNSAPKDGHRWANQRTAYPSAPRFQYAYEPADNPPSDAYMHLTHDWPKIKETVIACDILYPFYQNMHQFHQCDDPVYTLNQFLGVEHQPNLPPFENLTQGLLFNRLFEKTTIKNIFDQFKRAITYDPPRTIHARLPRNLKIHPRFQSPEVQISKTLIAAYVIFAHFCKQHFESIKELNIHSGMSQTLSHTLNLFSHLANENIEDIEDIKDISIQNIKEIFRKNNSYYAILNNLPLEDVKELKCFLDQYYEHIRQQRAQEVEEIIQLRAQIWANNPNNQSPEYHATPAPEPNSETPIVDYPGHSF
jgi:hypothetical protein